MRTCVVLGAWLYATCVSVSGASAQDFQPGLQRCHAGAAATGTVSGVLSPDGEYVHVGTPVRLGSSDSMLTCYIVADGEGRFEFQNVLPGLYEVHARLGLDGWTAIPIKVESEETAVVRFPVFEVNWVGRCLSTSDCGGILGAVTADELWLDASESLRVAAYRIAMAVAQEGAEEGDDWVGCTDASDNTIEALQALHSDIVPVSHCEMGSGTTQRPERSRLRHIDSGRLARWFKVDQIESEEGPRAAVHVSHGTGMLWAAGYRCELRYVERAWVAHRCTVTWLS